MLESGLVPPVETPTFVHGKRRKQILREIVDFEKNYLLYLQMLLYNFYMPLVIHKKFPNSSATFSLLFPKYLPHLIQFQSHFVSQLQKRFDGFETYSIDFSKFTIGDLYLEYYFKTNSEIVMEWYKDCIIHMESALHILRYVCQQNPSFATWHENMKLSLGQNIPSILIMPIQKFPRIVLLCKELIKETDEEFLDHSQLLHICSKFSHQLTLFQQQVPSVSKSSKSSSKKKKFSVKQQMRFAIDKSMQDNCFAMQPLQMKMIQHCSRISQPSTSSLMFQLDIYSTHLQIPSQKIVIILTDILCVTYENCKLFLTETTKQKEKKILEISFFTEQDCFACFQIICQLLTVIQSFHISLPEETVAPTFSHSPSSPLSPLAKMEKRYSLALQHSRNNSTSNSSSKFVVENEDDYIALQQFTLSSKLNEISIPILFSSALNHFFIVAQHKETGQMIGYATYNRNQVIRFEEVDSVMPWNEAVDATQSVKPTQEDEYYIMFNSNIKIGPFCSEEEWLECVLFCNAIRVQILQLTSM